jgi:hypothetical protein
MALLMFDGFDTYPDSAAVNAQPAMSFGGAGAGLEVPGRFGGVALESTNNFADWVWNFITAGNEITVGAAFRYTFTPSADGTGFFNIRSGTTNLIIVGVDNVGRLKVANASGFPAGLLGSSDPGIMFGSTWFYLEIEMLRSATVGELRIYLNGLLVIDLGPINTGASLINNVHWDLPGAMLMDDVYVCDTANEHKGDVRVETLRPNADTAQRDFSRSTGTVNFSLIDETQFNSDTDYVLSSTPGHLDYYDFGALSSTPAEIYAIRTRAVVRKDDAATRIARTKLKSGASVSNGRSMGLPSSYIYLNDIYHIDPDTGLPWSAAAINAIQAGLEVVS